MTINVQLISKHTKPALKYLNSSLFFIIMHSYWMKHDTLACSPYLQLPQPPKHNPSIIIKNITPKTQSLPGSTCPCLLSFIFTCKLSVTFVNRLSVTLKRELPVTLRICMLLGFLTVVQVMY